MNASPTVSVLIPAFNAEPFLDPAIESIRAQSFRDWELIIFNDGSTDGTSAICDRFEKQDPRIRGIHFSPNQGVACARILAARSARGRFITFLDADDLAHPDRLRIQVQWAERQPHEIIMCGTTHSAGFSSKCDAALSWELGNVRLWVRPIMGAKTMMMEKALYSRIGEFRLMPEAHAGCEGHDLLLRASLKSISVRVVPQRLYFYRQHRRSMTGGNRRSTFKRVDGFLTAIWKRHLSQRSDREALFARAMQGTDDWSLALDSSPRVLRKAAGVMHQLAIRLLSMGDTDLAHELLEETVRVCPTRLDAQLTRITRRCGVTFQSIDLGNWAMPCLVSSNRGHTVAVI